MWKQLAIGKPLVMAFSVCLAAIVATAWIGISRIDEVSSAAAELAETESSREALHAQLAILELIRLEDGALLAMGSRDAQAENVARWEEQRERLLETFASFDSGAAGRSRDMVR